MNNKTITKEEMKEAILESHKEVKRKKAGNTLGWFSIILGIISLIFMPMVIVLGFVMAILGFLIALFNKNIYGSIINLLGMFINGGFILLLV